jgi:hypothetical protein
MSKAPTVQANQSVEPTGGRHYGQIAFVSRWRRPPVALTWRWALMRLRT